METNNIIKVKVKKEYKNPSINEVLPLGYETELVKEYSKEDEIIFPFWAKMENIIWKDNEPFVNDYVTDKRGKIIDTCLTSVVIRPKGEMIGMSFIGANGKTYSSAWLFGCFNINLHDIFEKI